MKQFLTVVCILAVAGLTLLSGILYGRMTNRWGIPLDSLAAAETLEQMPEQFGDWKMASANEMSENVTDQLQCVGYVYRSYVNETTGETINVTMLLGPPGPISVHTPEVCYSSRAYEKRDERQMVTIESPEGDKDTFWYVTFRSSNLEADTLRVYYAWSPGKRWVASKQRIHFAGAPYIYKLQLAGNLPPGAEDEVEDPCRSFLEAFVPVAKEYLVEPSKD